MMTDKHSLKRWRWINSHASQGKQQGYLWARTKEEAFIRIIREKITITDLFPAPLTPVEKIHNRVRAKDITRLSRQLATLLSAGLSLPDALSLITTQSQNPGMQQLLYHLQIQISGGLSVTDCFRSCMPLSHEICMSLLNAGEASGQLEQAFEQLAQYLEKKEQIQAKMVKAAIYPITVLLCTTALTGFMLTTIIPKFETMFRQFGADLPWFTRQILTLSHQIQSHSVSILISITSVLIIFKVLYRHVFLCRNFTEKLFRHLPVSGKLLKESALIRCCRTLASGYHCGIPILICLQNAKQVTGLMYYEQALTQIIQLVSGGSTLYAAFRDTRCFPEFMVQMLMAGEESDTLDKILNQIADYYENRLNQTVEHLGQLTEPLIILILGVMVGGLIIAMYLPLFNLMTIVG